MVLPIIHDLTYWIYNLSKTKKKNSTQSKTSIPGLSICIKKDASNIAFERLGI